MTTVEFSQSHPAGAVEVTRTRRGDLAVLNLRTAQAAVAVVPELGAKIISLYDRLHHREWTWSPDSDRKLHLNRMGDAFDVSPLIGIDECIPTVAPCRVDGVDFPDHGEAWLRAWRLDERALETGAIVTELRLTTVPLIIHRTLSLTGPTLRLEYSLQNIEDRPVTYAWALHPLLAMRLGDRIDLPAGEHPSRVDSVVGIDGVAAGDVRAWTRVAPSVCARDLTLGATLAALKLYLPTPQPAAFAVVNALDGTALRGCYGPAELLPYLGVWITRGGWNGYHHFAIEPTNVGADRFEGPQPPAAVLGPAERRTWFVELTLGDCNTAGV